MARLRSRRKETAVGLVVSPARVLAERFSFAFLVVLSLILIVLSQARPWVLEGARTRTTDAFAPLFDAFSRPVSAVNNAASDLLVFFTLRDENTRLRDENARLRQWQQTALAIKSENQSLHELLNFKPEPGVSFISARIIAEPGGAFQRSFIITAGRRDGVREGLVAMAGEGLVGRVIETGNWSSRVLLITDMSSRLPVVLQDSHDRAILSGDNSGRPKLDYLSTDSNVKVGDRVVTSGHGGMFPAGLPVGVVAEVKDGVARVEPQARLDRADYVRLVDFNLPGGLADELSSRVSRSLPSGSNDKRAPALGH